MKRLTLPLSLIALPVLAATAIASTTATATDCATCAYTGLEIAGPLDVTLLADRDTAMPAVLPAGVRMSRQGNVLRLEAPAGGTIALRLPVSSLRELTVRDGANVEAGGLDTPSLALRSTGSGHIRLAGKVGQLTLASSGSASMHLTHLQPERVTLQQQGSGEIRFGKLTVAEFSASVQGRGRVVARGKAEAATLTASDGAEIELTRLEIGRLTARAQDGSSLVAHATEGLQASNDPSSAMLIYGAPTSLSIQGERVELGG
ncbi:GIN domain-containing protein [Chitinimonas sp. BJYL2]|uniref:GIN domain-containing protein n=1 Tax=Chitinimonas sp. BJYL2 TaxID=2976696 RepID=UPI0022B479A7|nr:DUF2807 domain-containing protein [Chitinimonas sp. BJYL2]